MRVRLHVALEHHPGGNGQAEQTDGRTIGGTNRTLMKNTNYTPSLSCLRVAAVSWVRMIFA